MFKTFAEVELFFKQRRKMGIKPGLERIEQLLKFCDHPEKKVDSIHVTGTNGKGSTIRYIEEALAMNNYRVGVFSSPSLKGLRGYMTIDGVFISKSQFVRLLNKLYPKIKRLDKAQNHPTEFEIITVIAFMFFQAHADISLIESGMGGRNDTTNCIYPLLSIITNVAYDHTQFLGETIEAIAYEKAGIIKEQKPVIIGEISPLARDVLIKTADQLHAPTYELNKEFTYGEYTSSNTNQKFVWEHNLERYNLTIQPKGVHQIKNCSIALMSLAILKHYGYNLRTENSLRGIQNTKITGRFEQIHTQPCIIIDGAHNVAGVQAFLNTVQTNYQETNKTLVFAAFKDKDINSMLEELIPHFTTIILTTFDHPRAATFSDLKIWEEKFHKIQFVPIEKIFKNLKHLQGKEVDGCYFITGSLSFINIIKNNFEKSQYI